MCSFPCVTSHAPFPHAGLGPALAARSPANAPGNTPAKGKAVPKSAMKTTKRKGGRLRDSGDYDEEHSTDEEGESCCGGQVRALDLSYGPGSLPTECDHFHRLFPGSSSRMFFSTSEHQLLAMFEDQTINTHSVHCKALSTQLPQPPASFRFPSPFTDA